MPSPCQHRRAFVCLTCGDKGDSKLLIYCRNCRDSAVHIYCLEKFSPNDDNIKWWCWDCRGEDIIKDEPLRKSERICSKRQRDLNMRTYWKHKLRQKKRLVQISKDIHKTGRVAIDGHLPIRGSDTNLVIERQTDLDVLVQEKPIPETVIKSEQNESIRIDEPMVTTNSNLPDEQEHHEKSFDVSPEIPELGNNEEILLFKDSDNAQSDGKDIGLQVSLPVVDNLPSKSDALCRQPYLEPDDFLSAEPISAAVWRGWFNIKEGSEICVEIFAHVSNKASWKVSDAAAAMPRMLDIKLVEKHMIWPKIFRAAPPTAASIGVYLFPAACDRDERVYESLLDEIIDRDLALKVVIHNIQLLIFPSSELPLQDWRMKGKYFLWGVFEKMRSSYSTTVSANSTQLLGHSQPRATGNKEDLAGSQHPSSPNQAYQSPVSVKSSQASNRLAPSTENTPESLYFELGKLDKEVGIR